MHSSAKTVPRTKSELNELTIRWRTLYSQDLLGSYGRNTRHIEDKSFNEAKERYVQEDIAELNMLKKAEHKKDPTPKVPRKGGLCII